MIKKKTAKLLCLTIAMQLFAILSFAQNLSVRGHVADEKGGPLSGASVLVKGTTTGVNTDAAGNFSISVTRGAILVVSALNYDSKEVKVNNATLSITLTGSEAQLGEVVVIGYGTQKKKDVTGSTVSVKGETLNEIKAPNIYNQLQGRAAGVDIVNNSSNIGQSGEIRIRGNRSLTGTNNPLLVVDGMVYGGSLNDLNPDNIANLDVLKDASATAIYGSRGSNGVIIITTKRGSGAKATTNLSSYYGMGNATGTYRLFNGAEYAQFKEDARQGQPGFLTNPAVTTQYAIRPSEDSSLKAGISTDWQNLLLQTAVRTGTDLSVSGGNEKTQYYFGMGYYKETAIMHDQALDRISFSVNIDHKISNKIKIGFTSFNTMSIQNRIGLDAYGSAMRLSPLFKPYWADGSLNFYPAIQQGVDNTQINPLASWGQDEKIKALTRRYQFQHNFYGEWEIIKDLKFKTTFGFGWSQTYSDNYRGPLTFFNTNSNTAGATLNQTNSEGWQYTINNSLNYNKNFGSKHKLSVLALQEIQKNHFQSQGFSGVGVPADYVQSYNFQLANSVTANNGNYSESAVVGYMGRAIYSYDNKYLLTATVRTDGASVLAPGNKWVTYPAISVGWNLDNEKFLQTATFISSLKLRAGYGISSNAGINPYTTLGSLSTSFYNYGAGSTALVNYVGGYTINTIPNPSLTWEKTTGINVGLDFGLFNNRITGSIEYYTTKTKDILLSKSLPVSQGANSILVNAGETASHGMEFTLSADIIRSKGPGHFSWRADANAFFNREKIVALQLGLQQDIGNGWFVGQPVSVIYDLKKIGIWQTKDNAQALTFGQAAGDIRLEDLNGNGSIDAGDRQIIGTFQPKVVAGLTNHFQYDNFDLNIVLFGRFGQTVLVNYLGADGGGAGYPFLMNSRVNQMKIDYWTPTNPTDAFPQPDASRDGQLYTSTLQYRDGSFIKVRSIDFGYNFSSKLLAKAKIQSLRFYINAQNPFILWSPLVKSGLALDPEGNGNGNNIAGTLGGGAPGRAITVGTGLPPVRYFVFGINLKF
ncbi:MAG: TonB-dependent receptor [Bacteroidota bacterium]